MAKHRVGDRRIISVSIPEDIARRLDARVGKGRGEGRSATISKMIESSLSGAVINKPNSEEKKSRKPNKTNLKVRVETDTMGDIEVPCLLYTSPSPRDS